MKININGIEIQAVIGTRDHERGNYQKIIMDIEFDYDASKASASDKLEYSVDYSKIVESAIKISKDHKFYLLETLAERIIGLLKENSMITSARVRVKKPSAIKNIEFVSAEANF